MCLIASFAARSTTRSKDSIYSQSTTSTSTSDCSGGAKARGATPRRSASREITPNNGEDKNLVYKVLIKAKPLVMQWSLFDQPFPSPGIKAAKIHSLWQEIRANSEPGDGLVRVPPKDFVSAVSFREYSPFSSSNSPTNKILSRIATSRGHMVYTCKNKMDGLYGFRQLSQKQVVEHVKYLLSSDRFTCPKDFREVRIRQILARHVLII